MLTAQLSNKFPKLIQLSLGLYSKSGHNLCMCVRQDFEDYLQTTIGFEKVDVIEPPGCDMMKMGQVGFHVWNEKVFFLLGVVG